MQSKKKISVPTQARTHNLWVTTWICFNSDFLVEINSYNWLIQQGKYCWSKILSFSKDFLVQPREYGISWLIQRFFIQSVGKDKYQYRPLRASRNHCLTLKRTLPSVLHPLICSRQIWPWLSLMPQAHPHHKSGPHFTSDFPLECI